MDLDQCRKDINSLDKSLLELLAKRRTISRKVIEDKLERGLDLRDPAGNRIHWVSPEGLAIDQEGERLWIINDPDSVKGNYRRRGKKKASGPYALYTPLLFELKLSELFPGQSGK